MDPIKGASAVDYAMTVPQNQNQIQGYEDYSSMPMVYEPEIAEKKKSASGMIGLTALGIIAAGGLGFLAGRNGVKGLKNQVAELGTINNELKTKLDAAEKKLEELTPAAKKTFKEKCKNFFGKLKFWGKKNADKAAEDTKKAADEANKK